MNNIQNTEQYKHWLAELKSEIQKTQIKAAISVNQQLLGLYWKLGRSISDKINHEAWGTSVVESLAKDLSQHFPNQKGFSRTNLFSMRKWYEFYSQSAVDVEFVQQLVGQIPWGHNVLIVTKSKDVNEALFYLNKTIENNWSRSVLSHQVELDLYHRAGKAVTNFAQTLPTPQSELASETLKDPYKFDFLTLSERALEKDIEEQLVQHITAFLLELGEGFSFVGKQVPIKIDQEDFSIDLLFYHIKLKCYVVIELKSVKFRAEYAGKMNLYLSAVDDLLKGEDDKPTIGLLLCKSKSKIIAEYALRGTTQPIGVAEYEAINTITHDIKPQLPSIEEIEQELTNIALNACDDSEE